MPSEPAKKSVVVYSEMFSLQGSVGALKSLAVNSLQRNGS